MEMPLGVDATTEEEYASQFRLLQEFAAISTIDKSWIKSDTITTDISSMFFLIPLQFKPILSFVIIIFLQELDLRPFVQSVNQIFWQTRAGNWFYPLTFQNKLAIREFLGTLMRLALLMLLRNHLLPSRHLHVRATRGIVPQIGTSATGKVKGNERRDGGKPMLEKGSLHFLSSTLTVERHKLLKELKSVLSVGQVVCAPLSRGSHQYLVFVGRSADTRKLGIKYCYNRPCALYAVRAPLYEPEADGQEIKDSSIEDFPVVKLTQSISSAYHPCFSPDGKLLLFLSARSAVDSGVHSATDSLHRIDWPMDGVPCSSAKLFDVFPWYPWFSDGCTMVISSFWGSCQVVLSVNVLSGEVLRINSSNSNFSWNVLSLDWDNIVAVSSSLVDVPRIKYGYLVDKERKSTAWNWLDVPSPHKQML